MSWLQGTSNVFVPETKYGSLLPITSTLKYFFFLQICLRSQKQPPCNKISLGLSQLAIEWRWMQLPDFWPKSPIKCKLHLHVDINLKMELIHKANVRWFLPSDCDHYTVDNCEINHNTLELLTMSRSVGNLWKRCGCKSVAGNKLQSPNLLYFCSTVSFVQNTFSNDWTGFLVLHMSNTLPEGSCPA